MPYADQEKAKEFQRRYYLEHREKKIKEASQYYLNNREKRDEQNKKWINNNIDKVREYRKNYYAIYNKTRKGKKLIKESALKWKLNNPDKTRCHYKIKHALKMGYIIKPKSCTECGAITKLHGHHSDYSKPLAVEWLCPICHKQKHKED